MEGAARGKWLGQTRLKLEDRDERLYCWVFVACKEWFLAVSNVGIYDTQAHFASNELCLGPFTE
jgi:hypothetical protein